MPGGAAALLADAVACAKAGQKLPEGYYRIQVMLGKILGQGEVALGGTCMDARGLGEAEPMDGARRSTLAQLAEWTVEAGRVLVFWAGPRPPRGGRGPLPRPCAGPDGNRLRASWR
jgi:hypothetical protein